MTDKHGFNLKLEQYLLGELPASELSKMEAELRTNADLRGRLERLRGDTNAYYAKYPRLKHTKKKSWWSRPISRILTGGLVFATATICIVLLLPHQNTGNIGLVNENDPGKRDTLQRDDNGVRSKGLKPDLFLSVVREAKGQPLANGNVVHAGDEIAIAYRSSGYPYGVILSVDAQHSVSLHFPESETGSQKLGTGSKVALKLAFKLDDKPGFEKFYFIAASQPMPLNKLISELKKMGDLKKPVDKDTHVNAIYLKKE